MPTVLIVDDDASVRLTMAHQLRKWQYAVLEAESGDQAFAILQTTPVSLILLDYMMPDCSGLDVFLQIKALFPTPPPVIMMSAYSSIELAVTFLKAGGTDFVQKPFEMDVVAVRIRQAIDADERQRYIRHELHKLSQAVEQSPATVVMTDLNGRIEYINPKCVKLTGYRADELIGNTPRIFKSGQQSEAFYHDLWQTITAGGEWHGEFCNKKKDGTLYWESASISPIRDQNGVMTHWVKVGEDITRRKDAERIMLEAKKLAEEANRAKSDFLAGVSHELRTPLNGILGYTQILQQDARLSEEQQRAIHVIHQSGEHLLLLVNEILDLSKIEARRLELMAEPIHLSSFLTNVVEIVRVRAQQKDLTFQAELDENLPDGIRADEKRLRQILLNLLGNAIKFTLSGSITFRVSKMAGTRPERPRIRFEIRDTGVGIPPEQLDKIFVPFHQVRDRRIRHEEGTGLGLPICQQLVQLMGGTIEVASVMNNGSVFSFDLEFPAVAVKRNDMLKGCCVPPVGLIGKERRILIADDVASNRALLRDMLTPLGFLLDEAADGQEALEKTLAFHPDAVLMDMVMPVMDGMTAVKAIRGHPELADTVVIALSANVHHQARESSLTAGCNEYLSKPIRMMTLFQALHEHLNIEWDYAAPRSPETPLFSPSLAYPALEAIGQLLKMAWQGDVIGVQDAVRELGKRDAALLPFVRTVEHLASNFLIEEMQDFLIQAVYDTYDAATQ